MSRSRQRQPEWGERGNHGYEYFLADQRPTCRMAVEEHPADSPFKDDDGRIMPENMGMERATVGRQRGTYFKTSLVRHHPVWGEMTVWHYGGVHPVDLANGVRAH
jgi:hypothetical protein